MANLSGSRVRKLELHLSDLHGADELGPRWVWSMLLNFARVASSFAFMVEVILALIHQHST